MTNPRDDSDRLKPCANCGSDGEVDQTEDGGYFIQCTNALCGMSTVLMYACGDDPVPILMEKWNRRASPQSPSGQHAELPPLPEFSYFLENSTYDMQRDAIHAYAKTYARLALSRSEQARAAASLQENRDV